MDDKHAIVERYIARVKKLANSSEATLDENIVFPLAALAYHGFMTADSCGGHLGRKTGGIYIDVVFPDYEKAMDVHNTLSSEKKEIDQHRIDLEIARTELKLILLLNEFYKDKRTKYENLLIIKRLPTNILRLQTVSNEIIDALADTGKRKDWLVASNKEFFDFGAYLFDNPSAT